MNAHPLLLTRFRRNFQESYGCTGKPDDCLHQPRWCSASEKMDNALSRSLNDVKWSSGVRSITHSPATGKLVGRISANSIWVTWFSSLRIVSLLNLNLKLIMQISVLWIQDCCQVLCSNYDVYGTFHESSMELVDLLLSELIKGSHLSVTA